MSASRPLNCDEALRRLDDYVDRELSSQEIRDVAAHLDICGMCSEEFDTEQELLAAIRAKLAHIKMPPDLMARISSRLQREQPGPG